MLSTIVALGILYISLVILYQIIYYRFLHPLSSFPGPFWGSVTRLWLTYHHVKATELQVFESLHKKHGPVIRITPTMLIVSDATKLPEIYSRYAEKSQHYITGSFGETESIFNIYDHAAHARLRKIAAAPYAYSNVKKMEPLVDAIVRKWLEKLDHRFAATGEKFDFAPWAVYMAYDIISEIGFGEPIGFIEQEKDVDGLIQGFHDCLVPFGVMARLYPLTKWIKKTPMGRYLVASPEHESGAGVLMRLRDRLVQKRYDDIKAGNTKSRIELLQTFIEARDENGKELGIDYIKAEVLLVLLAGSDTIGTLFQALLTNLIRNSDVYDKVMAEIDAVTRAKKLSQMPMYEEVLEHCPYYVACVKETMRINPPAPDIMPRLVPKGGLQLFGKYVPEGCEVTCNPWIVHRDTNVYGLDAEVFRPERWLDSERAKDFNKFSQTFGYGPRVCLGRDIAYMELYKAPLQFLRTFKPRALNENEPSRHVYKGGISYFKDMWLTLDRRPPMVELGI
ncbi:flavonoid 3',5'-hydroxylase [Daldinia vernicosa]|uniref:flavonoid 3',5'-hydroxylase n=1 Tax=Daldinia vernicosa TaxID=114800 RepID=UPI0020072204|nr:flavonoid 3',5'-hydroxylase [Daldinia vernicosa]KAI0845509.1 flavonoid 3',5'-hydroxylase [Daldinia vernicosa]